MDRLARITENNIGYFNKLCIIKSICASLNVVHTTATATATTITTTTDIVICILKRKKHLQVYSKKLVNFAEAYF